MNETRTPIVFPRPPKKRLSHGTVVALGIVVLVLAVAGWRVYPRVFPEKYRLTMTTGSFSGANYLLATQYLVPAAKAEGVELSFIQTGGSEDTLNAVQEGKVQVAFVDGGLGVGGRDNVREVAPLFTSGLHLLMKKELYEQAMATGDLRPVIKGKRVSLSNVGSGTRIFALDLLKTLGVQPGDYVDDPKTVNFLVDPKTTADQVPDVVFAASLLPSPVAQRLIADFDYRLYPLDFVDALRLQDKAAYPLVIPAGAYSLSPERPPKDVTTVGRRVLLVANKDTPDEAVFRVARAAFESNFARAYDPPLTAKQFDLISEFPRHPGATEYAESQKPVTQDAITNIILYLTGISALVVCLPLFVFIRGLMKKFRFGERLVSVNDYLALASQIESDAQDIEEGGIEGPRERETLLQLRCRLSELKLDAMDRFQQGLLFDPEHLDNLLAHVSDTRMHLNALIAMAEPPARRAEGPSEHLLPSELEPAAVRG